MAAAWGSDDVAQERNRLSIFMEIYKSSQKLTQI
jgi:hypothetical protein